MIPLPDLRVRLDQMTERIVSRLKDRSRYPLNTPVYQPGAVPIEGRSGISFLEFALEGLEAYHASLGRYSYPDQFPVFSTELPASKVARTVHKPALPSLRIAIKDDLLAFYLKLLPDLCPSGEDPDTYGETVYADSDLLEVLNERINVGRYVAQAKLDGDPSLRPLAGEALAARLRDAAREEALMESVRQAARRYQLEPILAERVFRWIIDETLVVEVAYVEGLAGDS